MNQSTVVVREDYISDAHIFVQILTTLCLSLLALNIELVLNLVYHVSLETQSG